MKTDKNTKLLKKINQEKLVINSITDLLKIPINKIHNTKIENFSGLYFDKIYEEAIKNESQSEKNKSSTSNKLQINKKIIKQNEKEINSPKLNEINKNLSKTKEIENNSINIKHYFYEEDSEIPKNKNRIEYQIIENNKSSKKLKDTYPRDEETEDNDEKENKNDFQTPYKALKPKIDINKRKNSQIPINKIIFSVNYNSRFGEEVAILGSLAKLGFWELSGALPLKWNEGNIWTGEINLEDEDYQNFEFKFIVVEKGIIKLWENGENNVIIFDELINNILSNKIGRYNKYKYEYNKNEETLFIKCHW